LSFQPFIFSQPVVFFFSQQISQHYFQPLIFSPSEQASLPPLMSPPNSLKRPSLVMLKVWSLATELAKKKEGKKNSNFPAVSS
jgi:hypothetical protein